MNEPELSPLLPDEGALPSVAMMKDDPGCRYLIYALVNWRLCGITFIKFVKYEWRLC